MAKLTAGLFSTPSGHNNGLVFGKARTTEGKKTTVREYVIPTNPNTPAQETQRTRFSYAVAFSKQFIPQFNSIGWNGAINNLPAFQGLMSYVTDHIDPTTGEIGSLPGVQLGNLYSPPNISMIADTSGLTWSWNTEAGPHSSDSDTVHIAYFRTS